MLIAHSIYRNKGNPVDCTAIVSGDVLEDERAFSWYWVSEFLSKSALSGTNDGSIILVSGLGERKDDGAILQWYNGDGYKLELVEGRFMSLLVQKQGLVKADILELSSYLLKFNTSC